MDIKMKKRILSLVLAGATMAGAASYAASDKETKLESDQSDLPSLESSLISYTTIEVEDILRENLYDETIDYNRIISAYLNADENEREILKNDYLKAIYMLLVNSEVAMSTYLNELNNIMIYQQVPMCLDDEEWEILFGNLTKVLGDNPSLFDMFFEFSKYVHEITCKEEHTLNEYYAYTCKSLQKERVL